MILLVPVFAGLLTGFGRAWVRGSFPNPPRLRMSWLVPLALFPQWLAFYLRETSQWMTDNLAAGILVGTQALLLIFAWSNRKRSGFWALGLGLALNLVVITLNGGLMPISPETVAQLVPDAPPDAWQLGSRLGTGKDVVLSVGDTRLWWLSDRFLLPTWSPYQVAFSAGDVLIAWGAYLLLGAEGSAPSNSSIG